MTGVPVSLWTCQFRGLWSCIHFICCHVLKRLCSDLLLVVQVFKGIKNGVQDVAVKVLINSDEIQVQMFQEVSFISGHNYMSLVNRRNTLQDCIVCFFMVISNQLS